MHAVFAIYRYISALLLPSSIFHVGLRKGRGHSRNNIFYKKVKIQFFFLNSVILLFGSKLYLCTDQSLK